MIRRPFTILCVVAAFCGLVAAQTAPPQPKPQDPQVPTFRTRVDSVSVDVTVTDKQGHPVTDLKQEDFEIRESGKVQSIDSFRLVQIDEKEPEGVEPPRQILSFSDMQRETANPENRLFIIFLDDYHTRLSNSLHIRQQLANFVHSLTSRDLVAVLLPLTSIGAATFSRDHDGTAQTIMNFKGRKYNYKAETPYEMSYAQLPPEAQEQVRNEIVINSLRSACALLSSLRDGRKTLLYVSEGLVANLPVGAQTVGSSNPFPTPRVTPTQAQQQAADRIQQSREFFNTTDLLGRMRDIFTSATRGNVSVYTIDPRGLAPSEFGAADNVAGDADRRSLNEALDSLRILADQTDGKALVGTNNILPELKKVVHELSAYYLLGYTSSIAPRDGKFHEIQVKVNRKDIEVHARKGYWAYTEEELRKASAPPKPGPPQEVAEALDTLANVVEPTSRRTVSVWVGATRGTAEQAQVTLVWEAMPGTPTTPADQPAQVVLTVTSGSTEVFKGPVKRDPAAYAPTGNVSFAAPAGPLRIKVAVENARGQRLDNEDISEMVPDFTASGATITEPLVFRARTARDITVLRGSATAVPVVTRQFSRSERLFMRFDAYGPAGTTPEIKMRILSRMGEPMPATPVPAKSTAGGSPAASTFDVDFGLSSLPSGDYLIEITATTAVDKTVKLVGIRVTG